MTSVVKSPYTSEQIAAWLRGLLTIAWADGNFDEQEQQLIASLTQNELAPKVDLGSLTQITPAELAAILGPKTHAAENFLRTAFMVALADGVYSSSEDELLHQFCEALGQKDEILESLRHTLYEEKAEAPISEEPDGKTPPAKDYQPPKQPGDALKPVRNWLDGLEVHDPRVARFLCKMIPSQCPFERDVMLFDHKVVHIPPLCKLNPLYDQLVGLRFRALSYLADRCGEDVSQYC
ncbi:TerB family tellurite resistance protein [Planktothrix sp. FACHB-1355]|uniref:TerB family tellurite resistance protein n=1 Tax=Aerosakkonema funiforme FACHB-1375 TaxID=2949571 RepID=A0A926V9B5_9CYAN|nr:MULTISPECIES: Mo-dependent nitrogenase C-terminal domain-containing protein [Oscillatoriales]MBD2179668.1 TerB family tellurite resistance protein [Aerosakkonema funiforme FACHB-1375]MBD3559433.1 TerB family tellurite resistance protein [Planktothrix sp. FACHB-1355]